MLSGHEDGSALLTRTQMLDMVNVTSQAPQSNNCTWQGPYPWVATLTRNNKSEIFLEVKYYEDFCLEGRKT